MQPFQVFRQGLKALANSRSTPQSMMTRAMFGLACASGQANKTGAACIGASIIMLGTWRKYVIEKNSPACLTSGVPVSDDATARKNIKIIISFSGRNLKPEARAGVLAQWQQRRLYLGRYSPKSQRSQATICDL
ncbi:MAG: hypothetical protein ACK6BG_10910 [Cyanobacteriota bacterium]